MIISSLRQKLKEDISKILDNKYYSLGDRERAKVLANIAIEEPKNKDFGDLSTNASMVLAPILRENPLSVAQRLKENVISKWDEVGNITIEKPGFINFNFKDEFIKKELKNVIAKKESFGFNNSGQGVRVQLEYVSSNPTGSLHIGHGRWGVLGDSLANIYAANGYKVLDFDVTKPGIQWLTYEPDWKEHHIPWIAAKVCDKIV